MARLRVYKANRGSIFDITLKKKQERIKHQRVEELDLSICKNRHRKASGETFDNIPALNAGKRNQLALALRGLRGI